MWILSTVNRLTWMRLRTWILSTVNSKLQQKAKTYYGTSLNTQHDRANNIFTKPNCIHWWMIMLTNLYLLKIIQHVRSSFEVGTAVVSFKGEFFLVWNNNCSIHTRQELSSLNNQWRVFEFFVSYNCKMYNGNQTSNENQIVSSF